MNTTEHREPTSVRLDPDVRERLEAFCRDTRRSRNNAINYLLDRALGRTGRTDQGWETR